MKSIIATIPLFVILLTRLNTFAQGDNQPKNFPEIFAGIEWNSSSGLTGLSYERYIVQKNKWVFGAKATHGFAYHLENLSLFGSASEESVSFNSVTATAHKFFLRADRGFFLCSEVGLGLREHKYFETARTSFYTAFEAGLGWHFQIGDKIAIRWTNTLTFAGKGGITMTKFSAGF